ncbi:MAG: ABC transporter ATP-binding protein [Coprobacillaceae bacterium]
MNKRKKSMKEIVRQLLPFMRPYKWGIITALLMVVITNICLALAPTVEGMVTTVLTKNVADIANKIPGAGIDFTRIIEIIIMLLIIYIVKTVAQVILTFCLTHSIQNTMKDVRNAIQDKISKLPVRYFDKNQYGDILSRITNDVDTVSNALQQTLTQVISGVLSIVLAFIMMFMINVVMALVVFILIPIALIITKIIVSRSQKRFTKQQKSLGELNGFITKMYTGHRELMIYNQQEQAMNRFMEINETLRSNANSAQFMSSMISPLISLVTYLLIGSIAVIGGIFAINGTLQIGQIQAFVRYIWQINDPISQVSNLSSQIQTAFAAMERVIEILQEKEEETITSPHRIEKVEGNVSIKEVTFGYDEKLILKGIDIEAKSGQMIAVVGPTGSGKTTLINLLMRFYDVTSGSIKIDGIDIREMDREYLRSIFAMVLQDTWLFSGRIYDNIRYGRLEARKDEIIDAAKLANVHHFIRTLPDGYNHEINEDGSNISQGEKQLLTIARAILKNPQILILDEATSSVDTRVEKMLQEAMHNVMHGRTSFVIAHRLSTIKNADSILVMRDGNIVEQGNHDTLLKQEGFYAQLYNSQFSEQE